MRKRITSAVLASTLAIGAAFPATAATSVGPGVRGVLDRLPDDVVAGALVRHDGAGAAAGPVTADAHFRIGSVTKVFTSTVVLQFVAEHRVDLDAPAHRYVPELMPRQYDGVTVRQLRVTGCRAGSTRGARPARAPAGTTGSSPRGTCVTAWSTR